MDIKQLSLSSDSIRPFFSGDNSRPPTRELVFLHTHPLLRPNFLTEIEDELLKAANALSNRSGQKSTEAQRQVLYSAIQEIANALPNLSQDNALEVLKAMRNVYTIAKSITGTP